MSLFFDDGNGIIVLTIDYRASSRTPCERSSQDGMVSLFCDSPKSFAMGLALWTLRYARGDHVGY